MPLILQCPLFAQICSFHTITDHLTYPFQLNLTLSQPPHYAQSWIIVYDVFILCS